MSNGEKKLTLLGFLRDNLATVAIGVLTFFGVILTNKISALDLLSKREAAETSLRAQMFTSLLDPLVGAKTGQAMSVEKEVLMVSLLALNFHEDFELKPLLLHADDRLAHPRREGEPESTAVTLRDGLRSIARRVTERQIAAVFGTALQGRDSPSVTEVVFKQADDYCLALAGHPDSSSFQLRSPDGKHELELSACRPDWGNQTVRVNYICNRVVQLGLSGDSLANDLTGAFTLTWFDLPLTDNLLLDDGNRFAITIRSMFGSDSTVTLKVLWFPRSFFTPRERPTDYASLTHALGMAKH